MKEFWDKYKMAIISIVIVLIIILVIYYLGKGAGKKYVPNDIVIPPDIQAPGTPSIYNPGPVTDALFKDLDCIFCFHNATPYSNALALSNSQLAAVYNDWNKRYAAKFDGMTIIQAIADEKSATFNQVWATAAGSLINRFKSLYGAQG